MKNRRVLLLDVGHSTEFDAYSTFIQALLGSINVDGHECEFDLVKSAELNSNVEAFTTAADVLHISAHGSAADDDPVFSSHDEDVAVYLSDVAEHLDGSGLGASAVLADGCSTGTRAWQRSMRRCLTEPITYIGAARRITWADGTLFSSLFYSALLSRRGKGFSSQQWTYQAAEKARQAYMLVRGTCPYTVLELKPLRGAGSTKTNRSR